MYTSSILMTCMLAGALILSSHCLLIFESQVPKWLEEYISLWCRNCKIWSKPGGCFWVQGALPQENLWTKDSFGDLVQPSSTQFNLFLASLLLPPSSSSTCGRKILLVTQFNPVQLLSCQPPPTSSSSPLFVPAQVYALLGLNHHSLQMTYEFFQTKIEIH